MFRLLSLLLMLSIFACKSPQLVMGKWQEGLEIRELSPGVFVHISPINLSNGEVYPCNGMIVIDSGEAIVFDTPVYEKDTEQLIKWLQEDQKVRIKAIVPTHFHDDCLGGLSIFHKADVPSYAHTLTRELAKEKAEVLPQKVFNGSKSFQVGKVRIECWHPGEAHTQDNIVAWVPTQKTLFGGCMLKALGVGKGNLADANVEAWSTSMQAVKARYPDLRLAIPGHGAHGGMELLDFTIELFAKD